jgi:hypothetical protein
MSLAVKVKTSLFVSIVISVSVGLSLALGGTPATPPGVAEITTSMQPFHEVRVVGEVRVFITPGRQTQVAVTGDERHRRSLNTRVESGRLIIENPGVGTAEIRVTCPSLSSLIAEGRSQVEVQGIEKNSLIVMAYNSSKVTVTGSAPEVMAVIEDEGVLDASRLKVETADVVASGRSSGVFAATRELNVLSSGEAHVAYLGLPDHLNRVTSDHSPRSDRSTSHTRESASPKR